MRVVDCVQGTAEWWIAKRGIPSASNFSKIITPKTGKLSAQADDYICELIADRAQLYPPEDVEKFVSREMQNGIDCEPEARRWYAFEAGAEVLQVGFCISDCGRWGCSPDGLVGDDGLVEIKCPSLKTQVKYLLEGSLPDQYKPQCHGQLLVTGRKWVDFLSYAPGLAPLLVRVTPDEYTAKLKAALEEFWVRYFDAADRILGDQPTEAAA